MPLEDRTLKICNCNKTMALDAKALAGALKLRQPIQIHTELCRKEVGSFEQALKDDACVVACTQEAPLFSEIAEAAARRRRRRSPRCSRLPICPSPSRSQASRISRAGSC